MLNKSRRAWAACARSSARYRALSTALCIATSASMLMACGSSTVLSRSPTAKISPALLQPPAQFPAPPRTHKGEIDGGSALPWALELLDIGGQCRVRLIDLQDAVKAGTPEPAR